MDAEDVMKISLNIIPMILGAIPIFTIIYHVYRSLTKGYFESKLSSEKEKFYDGCIMFAVCYFSHIYLAVILYIDNSNKDNKISEWINKNSFLLENIMTIKVSFLIILLIIVIVSYKLTSRKINKLLSLKEKSNTDINAIERNKLIKRTFITFILSILLLTNLSIVLRAINSGTSVKASISNSSDIVIYIDSFVLTILFIGAVLTSFMMMHWAELRKLKPLYMIDVEINGELQFKNFCLTQITEEAYFICDKSENINIAINKSNNVIFYKRNDTNKVKNEISLKKLNDKNRKIQSKIDNQIESIKKNNMY